MTNQITDTDQIYKTPSFSSKLPKVGTTIFTVMSALATEQKAINLGQGFPDFDCDNALLDYVNTAMRSGLNQYPPMTGIPSLRKLISEKILALYGHLYDPENEITITAGGTQGILTIILATVKLGDEVVIIEPAYDCYAPAVELAGGKVIAVKMLVVRNDQGTVQSYELPWESLKAAINDKTRLVIINSPHNPTGMVWNSDDLDRLTNIIRPTNALVCSDEVYEHMVYERASHQSVSRHAELASRSFLVSSFGKTYHVTGWKVGFVAAPTLLTQEFRKVHQFNVFTVNTPMQYGLAKYLEEPEHYLNLPKFYQKKRDFLRNGLEQTNFSLLPAPGTYFQCVDYTGLKVPEAKLNEADFCKWLTIEIGVAAIPLSAFYSDQIDSGVIRFCFAKKEATLETALKRLKTL